MSIYEYYVGFTDEVDGNPCNAKGIVFGASLSDAASIIESYYGCGIVSAIIDEVAFDETGIFEGYTVERENEDGH